ncbi:dTDP-4-amino-4,6-dideoxygalactose transaminase [Christiangramia gaetbulicola]|uniref:dTDP-4-amino-4,6-dideoxygalactose transaminase n=1 Tax=Christiangramia gaetbulicola TaxID=703340 RepID=A0A2T6ANL0_9FLAO|nr:DegT/DnrJ/EryC1/StrS family aminotransferase [Christiangramia gaetbulicola]PTX45326.1 dTDP-4-amino-4,6-dideoxygalactose transaminase [Christiangramia gaetbulicola]
MFRSIVKQKIPFLDLKIQHQQIKNEIFQAFEKVYENTSFSGGAFVEEFEKDFAEFCRTDYAIGVNNGTSALHLAMIALGIGEGDEVIIPANTFIATAWGVSYTGAKPVFVDCTADTWQIDPSKVEEKITPATKAIIGVHLYGQPFDVEGVSSICKRHKLFLLEDAAQAQGAKYENIPVGGFGEMGCFSFYPGKNLGACGEAGGITTNNKDYYNELQRLRNHGCKERYYHDILGYNMRMGGLEAASLGVKIKYLQGWNQRRKEIAKKYHNGINNPAIKMQSQPDWADSVYHLFVIVTKNRENLMEYLNKQNIFPGLHYPVPCHLQKAYTHLGYKKGDCLNAEYLSNHCLSLPMYSELTDENVEYIIEVLNAYDDE